MIGVIQGIFISTSCLILLTFLLKINCLQVNTLNSLLIKLSVVGLHPLHWGHCEFCICLHRVCKTLKIPWAKFILSKATKEAITKKSQSLQMTTNKGKYINSKPNMKPVILLLGFKPFLYCRLLWLLVFAHVQECIG